MVAQENNEHCSESLMYSKAIVCSCPDNIRSAEKIFSQAEINHIVQENGYDEACPSMLLHHCMSKCVQNI